MVVQATMLQAIKPRVGEGGSAPAQAAGGTPPPAQAQAQAAAQKPEAPTAADLQRTVQDAKGVADAAGANLQFSIDKDSGKTIVKVVDVQTSEVIRQIPSEELVSLARNMTKLEGMLLDQKA